MHFQFDIIVMQMDMMIAHLSLRIDLPAEIYQRTLSTLDLEIDVSGRTAQRMRIQTGVALSLEQAALKAP